MASKIELQLGQPQAIDSLRWWIRVGVTNALDEMPHDRFADVLAGDGGERGAPNASESTHQSPRSLSETASRAVRDGHSKKMPETAEISARALAQTAADLETLRSVMAEFDGCRSNRAPIRWKSGAIAGSHAERDWTGSTERLHRQCRTMAASGQPNPDPSGDADLSAFH